VKIQPQWVVTPRKQTTMHKDIQMLVLNFIFDLLWTGRGFSVSSVAFLGFRELALTLFLDWNPYSFDLIYNK
jgi:hypothetical protein